MVEKEIVVYLNIHFFNRKLANDWDTLKTKAPAFKIVDENGAQTLLHNLKKPNPFGKKTENSLKKSIPLKNKIEVT